MSTRPRTHTPAELAELERVTGLALLCWLDLGAGGLLPVLARSEHGATLTARRRAALRLNGRADGAPAEAAPRSSSRAAG